MKAIELRKERLQQISSIVSNICLTFYTPIYTSDTLKVFEVLCNQSHLLTTQIDKMFSTGGHYYCIKWLKKLEASGLLIKKKNPFNEYEWSLSDYSRDILTQQELPITL